MSQTFSVVIKSYKDPGYRHVVGTGKTERAADRLEDAISINLDHENYYVDSEPEETP